MKNLSLVLNFILLVAVGVLFYLHFKKPASNDTVAEVKGTALPVTSTIVYVNTDSLLDNYTYFKNKKQEFENKDEQIKKELKADSDRLQDDAQKYQENAPAMTPQDRAKTEEQLMIRQQNLMKKKDALVDNLDSEHEKFQKQLYDKLNEYLSKYNKTRNYSFILSYARGGGILYANDSLDVTKQVLQGLNEDFAKAK